MPADRPALTAKRSYRKGCVAVAIRLRCSGYPHDSAGIQARTDASDPALLAMADVLEGESDA